MESGEMRRCVGVDRQAFSFEPGADHGLGRTLAVGAGDVDHGRQLDVRVSD